MPDRQTESYSSGASVPELKALQKLAETAVFTSQGVPLYLPGMKYCATGKVL